MLFSAPAIILPPEKPAIVRASDLKGLPSWQEMERRERAFKEGSFPFPMFVPGGSGGNDAYTKLLCHFDGADAATTTSDSSASAHTFTFSGNAQLDTADSKFGSASLLLDGTGDYITTADSADWTFGTGDFTWDFWAKRGGGVGSEQKICGNGDAGLAAYHYVSFTAANVFRFTMNNDTYTANGATVSDTTTWHHYVVERYGNNLRVAVDGTFGSPTDITGQTYTDSSGGFSIGRLGDYAASSVFNGWVDEFRISKGIARYQGTNFTPPIGAYS